MADDILSQEEVDALLKGVTGDSDAEAGADDEAGGPKAYNLASQDKIVRGRMPTMEVINERFARNLRQGLFNFTRRTPEISVGPVKLMKYAEFVRNLVVPTNLNMVQVHPLRGTALMIFDPNLVFHVIDSLFGGGAKTPAASVGNTSGATVAAVMSSALGGLQKAFSAASSALAGILSAIGNYRALHEQTLVDTFTPYRNVVKGIGSTLTLSPPSGAIPFSTASRNETGGAWPRVEM